VPALAGPFLSAKAVTRRGRIRLRRHNCASPIGRTGPRASVLVLRRDVRALGGQLVEFRGRRLGMDRRDFGGVLAEQGPRRWRTRGDGKSLREKLREKHCSNSVVYRKSSGSESSDGDAIYGKKGNRQPPRREVGGLGTRGKALG
jgi:hypothetical protein